VRHDVGHLVQEQVVVTVNTTVQSHVFPLVWEIRKGKEEKGQEQEEKEEKEEKVTNGGG